MPQVPGFVVYLHNHIGMTSEDASTHMQGSRRRRHVSDSHLLLGRYDKYTLSPCLGEILQDDSCFQHICCLFHLCPWEEVYVDAT